MPVVVMAMMMPVIPVAMVVVMMMVVVREIHGRRGRVGAGHPCKAEDSGSKNCELVFHKRDPTSIDKSFKDGPFRFCNFVPHHEYHAI